MLYEIIQIVLCKGVRFEAPEGWSFYFVCGFPLCANVLSFISVHLFTFVFIFIPLGGGSKKRLFSSASFISSNHTFRS